jgi:hypothetical protein
MADMAPACWSDRLISFTPGPTDPPKEAPDEP